MTGSASVPARGNGGIAPRLNRFGSRLAGAVRAGLEPEATWSRRDWWAIGLLALLVGLLYGRTVGFAFLNWDDLEFVLNLPLLQHPTWSQLLTLFRPWEVPGVHLYLPLTYLSHLVEAALFGLNPVVFHATNGLLHLVSTLLAYRLARDLREPVWVAWLAAAAFAAHPLQVEAVAWVSARKDLLATMFALAALCCQVRGLRGQGRRMFLAAWLLFALSAMSKPSALLLPLVFLLLEWSESGRVSLAGAVRQLPFVAVAAAVWFINHCLPVPATTGEYLFLYRCLCVPQVALGWLARLLLLETPQPGYLWPDSEMLCPTGIELAMMGGILAGLWMILRHADRRTFFLFGTTILLGGPAVLMVLMVLSQRTSITADRYGYLAMFGIYLALARMPRLVPARAQAWALGAVTLWLFVAIGLSFSQVSRWHDNFTLWQPLAQRYPVAWTMSQVDAWEKCPPGPRREQWAREACRIFAAELARSPGELMTRLNYGVFLRRLGEPEAALRQFRLALVQAPNDHRALFNFGKLLVRGRKFAQARVPLQRLVALSPSWDAAIDLLARAYYEDGLAEEAERVLVVGLGHHPGSPELLFQLACLQEQRGDLVGAEQNYRQALVARPEAVYAYNLANLYLKSGQLPSAEEGYRQALRLAPDHQEATINLGGCLVRQGRLDEALVLLDQAAGLGADSTFLRYYRGLALIGVGRPDEARRELRQALELDPNSLPAAAALRQLEIQP